MANSQTFRDLHICLMSAHAPDRQPLTPPLPCKSTYHKNTQSPPAYGQHFCASTTPRMIPPAIEEKRVTFHHLNWQAYQQILHALPQSRSARLTDDRGILEITMPLEDHEFAARLIERFIYFLVVEMGLKIKTMGSTTPESVYLAVRQFDVGP